MINRLCVSLALINECSKEYSFWHPLQSPRWVEGLIGGEKNITEKQNTLALSLSKNGKKTTKTYAKRQQYYDFFSILTDLCS